MSLKSLVRYYCKFQQLSTLSVFNLNRCCFLEDAHTSKMVTTGFFEFKERRKFSLSGFYVTTLVCYHVITLFINEQHIL